jgi:hypothetical protein
VHLSILKGRGKIFLYDITNVYGFSVCGNILEYVNVVYACMNYTWKRLNPRARRHRAQPQWKSQLEAKPNNIPCGMKLESPKKTTFGRTLTSKNQRSQTGGLCHRNDSLLPVSTTMCAKIFHTIQKRLFNDLKIPTFQ